MTTPAVGMRFGRYEIVAPLGAGAMGEVYEARDVELGRHVAIKFLPTRFASDPGRLARFSQEARAASSLNHPSIVTIHDIGQTAGLPYIVMEQVRGQTLRQLLRGQPLPARQALTIASQLAEGLARAHAAGIAHRDLKPENIMVTSDGLAKILDFGLAKLLPDAVETTAETQAPATTERTIVGTAGYMSPEQASGRPVDFRTDQFALGAILYEMATGRRAFLRETSAQTLSAIIEDEPAPIATLNPAFPAPARWIVDRCLAKDPAGRYASTLDLAHELRDVVEHFGETSTRDSGARRPRRLRLRAWHGIVLVAAVVAALVGGPPVVELALERLQLLPLPAEKRIAVLPITSRGGSPEDQAVCEGMLDYLVARLGELDRAQRARWVVPASEVRQSGIKYAASAQRGLGATIAVEITVQRVGDQSIVSATLVDTAKLRVLRSGTRRGPQAAGLLLDQVVDLVIGMLDVEVGSDTRAALRAGGTTVAEASSLYAQGLAQNARASYERAQTALQRYDQQQSLQQAIDLFNRALARDDRYALAHAGLGETYLRLWDMTRRAEDFTRAEQESQRALALDNRVTQAWLTLGALHTRAGNAEQAVGEFRHALDRDPQSGDVLRELARAYGQLKRPQDAEATYRRALALRPDSWAVYNYFGIFLLGRQRYRESEAAFRRAIELAPDNARVWSNLGVALYFQGRGDEAETAFTKSISFYPTASALSNVGTSRFFKGQYAEAARLFERATQVNPRDYRVWRNLAAAYWWASGERPKAPQAASKCLDLGAQERRISANDAGLLSNMADCSAMLGDRNGATALATEAVKLKPDDSEVTYAAATVYEMVGDRGAALRWLGVAAKAGKLRADVDNDPVLAELRADPRYQAVWSGQKPHQDQKQR